MTVEIEILTPSAFDELAALRELVWTGVAQHAVPEGVQLIDELDHKATVFGIRRDARLVASARVSMHASVDDIPELTALELTAATSLSGPISFLSRLVVAPDARRNGVARALDEVRVTRAKEKGARWVVCRHALGRTNRLQALGFTCIGTRGADRAVWWHKVDVALSVLDLNSTPAGAP